MGYIKGKHFFHFQHFLLAVAGKNWHNNIITFNIRLKVIGSGPAQPLADGFDIFPLVQFFGNGGAELIFDFRIFKQVYGKLDAGQIQIGYAGSLCIIFLGIFYVHGNVICQVIL